MAHRPFADDLFVQTAAFDRGLPPGCALHVAHECGENIKPITHVFHGSTQKENAIKRALAVTGMTATVVSDPADTASALLMEGSIVGWFQGRSEFGPRALRYRSILVNSGSAHMKDEINVRVKYWEKFRPFAPYVLEKRACQIFDMIKPSLYMTVTFNFRDGWGEKLSATTHINNTARVQTVNADVDSLYHTLISGFEKLSGLSVVFNTSVNI